MTDNEIVKALEIYPSLKIIVNNVAGYTIVAQDLINIINRQKAEIERLEAMIDAVEEHFVPLPFKNKFDEYIEKSNAEAIKEFADRVKREVIVYSREDIDNLVKEMTEETK